jgi:hypothetical protein
MTGLTTAMIVPLSRNNARAQTDDFLHRFFRDITGC